MKKKKKREGSVSCEVKEVTWQKNVGQAERKMHEDVGMSAEREIQKKMMRKNLKFWMCALLKLVCMLKSSQK